MKKSLIVKLLASFLIAGLPLSVPYVQCYADEAVPFIGLRINSDGQTYGSALFSDTEPDLVLAEATNGKLGYVDCRELMGQEPSSPKSALLGMSQRPLELPVYLEDGITVIGTFTLTNTAGKAAQESVVPLGTAYGNKKYFNVNGRQYYNQAHVHAVVGYGYVQSRVKVGASSGSNLPAGSFGVFSRLYNSVGVMVASSGYIYSDSACISFESPATYDTTSGSYYADGYTRVWNSSTSSYNSQYVSKSPMQSM